MINDTVVNDSFQERPDVLRVLWVIGRLRPQDKLPIRGKLEACGNLITKLDSRLSDEVSDQQREMGNKETKGLGIKDQSPSTLSRVVDQVNVHGGCVRFPSGDDVLLVEAWP